MYHAMSDGNWFWMSFMMVFGAIVIGAIIYLVVRVANRPRI
jgi:hypothetical protein